MLTMLPPRGCWAIASPKARQVAKNLVAFVSIDSRQMARFLAMLAMGRLGEETTVA